MGAGIKFSVGPFYVSKRFGMPKSRGRSGGSSGPSYPKEAYGYIENGHWYHPDGTYYFTPRPYTGFGWGELCAVLLLFSPFILLLAIGFISVYFDDQKTARHDACIAEWVAAHPGKDDWWAERQSDCQVSAPSP